MTASMPDRSTKFGIILTNVGTPDAPTPTALRPYLKEFLSDPRVVDYPRWLWLPLLHGVILNTRPRRSARLYERIWTPAGAPLLTIMRQQAAGLRTQLEKSLEKQVAVEIGLRYGSPSIASALRSMRDAGIDRILVFPLYPQYSTTTTATTFDAVFDEVRQWSKMPEIRTITEYDRNDGYLESLANSVREYWQTHERPEKLLFSFHGIPQRYETQKGDPYPAACRQTAHAVAQKLKLEDAEWSIAFQSRFGPEEWLKPYTDVQLESWALEGVRRVHVIAAGFSADCLETVDELGNEARETFMEAGGKDFHYIPALNDRPDHLKALAEIARQHTQGW